MEIFGDKEMNLYNKSDSETSSSSLEMNIEDKLEPIKELKKSYDSLEKVSLYWNYATHKREKLSQAESDIHIRKILPTTHK